MKLLQIKKLIMIFGLILTLILGTGKVEALENIDLNYDDEILISSFEKGKERLDKIMAVVKEYEAKDSNFLFRIKNEPRGKLSGSSKTDYRFEIEFFYKKTPGDFIKNYYQPKSFSNDKLEFLHQYQYSGKLLYSWGTYVIATELIDDDTFNYRLDQLKIALDGILENNLKASSYFTIMEGTNSGGTKTFSVIDNKVQYSVLSNLSYVYYYISDGMKITADYTDNDLRYSVNGETIENGKVIPTYYDFYISTLPNTSIDINIGYNCELDFDIPSAQITLKFNNYDSLYEYQYSLNGKDYITINNNEIKNSSFTFRTYMNGYVYARALDFENNIVYETDERINGIFTDEKIFTYEIPLTSFYDSNTNKLKYTYFFIPETLENLYFGITVDGENKIPLYIYNQTSISNKTYFLRNLGFNNFFCSSLPYEYVRKGNNTANMNKNTAFVITPCINLENDSISNYDTTKIIIKTTAELDIKDFISIDGVLTPHYPETNPDNDKLNFFIMNLLNPILSKFPIINQFEELYSILNYNYGTTETPSFVVDFNFLGIDKKLEVIDFSIFLEYRDTIFAFEKISLAILTVMRVLKEVKEGLGGN